MNNTHNVNKINKLIEQNNNNTEMYGKNKDTEMYESVNPA